MELKILLLIQKLDSPLMGFISNLFSFFSEMTFLMIVLFVVYWAFSKKSAFMILTLTCVSLDITNGIKSIVRRPRPFQVYGEISGGRLSTATGYSFPSGHAATSSSAYLSSALEVRRKAFTALAIILIVGSGLSRLYFGVHFPSDVAVGYFIGIFTVLLLHRTLTEVWVKEKYFRVFSFLFGSLSMCSSLIISFLIDYGFASYTAYSDLATILSVQGASILGMLLEREKVNFSHENNALRKTLVCVAGVITSIAIMLAVSLIPLSHKLGTFIQMSSMSLWATYVYPAAMVKAGFLKQNMPEENRDTKAHETHETADSDTP